MNSTAGWSNSSIATTGVPQLEELEVTECDSPEHSMSNVFVFLHIAIIIFGFPSNCFSVFVSYRHIKQSNELGVYLMNLALADLFFITMLPIWIDYSLADVWHHGATPCVVCVFLMFTHFYTSVFLLCCIAIDRYLAVVYPLRYPFVRKLGTAMGICVFSWVCSVAFNMATLSVEDVYNDEICLDIFPIPKHQVRVNIARFFIWFLVPSLLVGFCYWKISQEVKSNRATEKQERKKICWLLGLVQLTLLVCFGPIHIMLVLRGLLENCQTVTWLFYPYKFSVAIATCNCVADPLLYCFITRSGKASFVKVFLFLQRKDTSNRSGGEIKEQFCNP